MKMVKKRKNRKRKSRGTNDLLTSWPANTSLAESRVEGQTFPVEATTGLRPVPVVLEQVGAGLASRRPDKPAQVPEIPENASTTRSTEIDLLSRC